MKTYAELKGDGGSRIVEQVTEKASLIARRLASVRRIVAVASGKGGVGKSTVTANLALSLARDGYSVGVLDADINGSSIPDALGLKEEKPRKGDGMMLPPESAHGVKVMSLDFFLASANAPIDWGGTADVSNWLGAMEATAIGDLLADTDWGELDFLLIDTPPSLARLKDLRSLIPRFSGALLVTAPSPISMKIVLKAVETLSHTGIPVLGLVENMKGYTCSHCGGHNDLFGMEGLEETLSYVVPYLGGVPFGADGAITDGNVPDGEPLASAFSRISERLLKRLDAKKSGNA